VIEWLTAVEVALVVAAGLTCLALGLAGRRPNDLTLGAMLLVEVLLIIQLVVAIIAPATGNHPTGSALEFYAYLVGAILVPPLATLWALMERGSRWSTVVLGVAGLSVAVMLYRMGQIWFVQVA
jgi:RsiW-degrading membrane proteinase PrsW (M82 family)